MSTSHKLTDKITSSRDRSSNTNFRLRLSKSNAIQFERLCQLYPLRSPQDLLNDLLSLALGLHAQNKRSDYAKTPSLSDKANQHVHLMYGPFAEFHGLVFKNHTAMDRRFSVDKSEADIETKTQIDTYALDDRGS